MASNSVGGPSNHGFDQYAELGEEEQQDPAHAEASTEATTSTAGPAQQQVTQQQIAARYDTSEQHMGPTDDPPAFDEPGGSTRLDYTPTLQEQNLQRLLARRQQQRQASSRRETAPPSIDTPGLSENPANDPALRARQSTSRLQRAFSRQNLSRQPSQASLGAQSNASTSSFGTVASPSASRINLRTGSLGRQGSGDAPPPVPPLPAAFRQGTLASQLSSQSAHTQEGAILSGGEITSEPVPHEAPPSYPAAGSSTGPGTLAGAATAGVTKSSRFGNLGRNLFKSSRELDPQGAANHDLREALQKGNTKDIAKWLNATNPTPNPATPSSKHQQNAFHKVSLSSGNISRETTDQLFEKTPVGLRAAAARAQDDPDRNTPLHLVQQQIGKLQKSLELNPGNQGKIDNLQYLATKLREASAAGSGPNDQPLDEIRNKANRTPDEERREARRTASAVPGF